MKPDPNTVARHLSDRDNAVSADSFPADADAANRPGLYSWWVDEPGRRLLEASLGQELSDLIYAGQAGATSSRARKPSTATLGSRIGGNHINGTAYGSTFRKTLSALLLEPLGLAMEKSDRLIPDDRKRVTDWIGRHLSVAIYPYDDRESLGDLEKQVLGILDPPLNIEGMAKTQVRRKVSELRRKVAHPDL